MRSGVGGECSAKAARGSVAGPAAADRYAGMQPTGLPVELLEARHVRNVFKIIGVSPPPFPRLPDMASRTHHTEVQRRRGPAQLDILMV